RRRAAMKTMLPSLRGVVLCPLALNSAAADPTAPLPTKPDEGWHAAVTDMPGIIDMSHADPRTWDRLPPAARGAYVKQEVAEKVSDHGKGGHRGGGAGRGGWGSRATERGAPHRRRTASP